MHDIKNPANYQILRILKKLLIIHVILFICTTPIFCAIILLELNDNIYMISRLIRFILVIIIGFSFCKKNEDMLFQSNQLIILCTSLIFVSAWLHFKNITHKFYLTISSTLGIYNQGRSLFLAVLWEGLFTGDLYWSILICVTLLLIQNKYHKVN